jgi:hypothetical protein
MNPRLLNSRLKELFNLAPQEFLIRLKNEMSYYPVIFFPPLQLFQPANVALMFYKSRTREALPWFFNWSLIRRNYFWDLG